MDNHRLDQHEEYMDEYEYPHDDFHDFEPDGDQRDSDDDDISIFEFDGDRNSRYDYFQGDGTAHQSHHHSLRHHHRHHRRHTLKKTLIVITLSFVIILVVLFLGWRILDAFGKRALYIKADASAPTLTQIPEELETVNEEEPHQLAVDVEHWEEGWIRYKGNVYAYNQDILTFLIMGIDSVETVKPAKDYVSGGRADGLYLVVINPNTKKISLAAINRNTMVPMDVYDADGNLLGNYEEQICLAHTFGDGMTLSCESQEKAISELFYNLPIHGYLSLNMGGIVALNDTIGGVTVPEMTYQNGEIIYGKEITVLGKDAYSYLRYRGKDFDSASYRLEKQKEYIKAFGQKALAEVRKNPTKALDLYNAISPYVVTDFDVSKITYLAGQFSSYSLETNVYGLTGNVDTNEETGYEQYHYDERQLYDMMIELFYKRVK